MKKIIIADDNQEILLLLKNFFTSIKLIDNIIFCYSYKQLLDNINNQISCIITDYNFPEISGVVLIKKLRKIYQGTIIVITGDIVHKDVNDMVDFVLQKPFSLKELKRNIEVFCNN